MILQAAEVGRESRDQAMYLWIEHVDSVWAGLLSSASIAEWEGARSCQWELGIESRLFSFRLVRAGARVTYNIERLHLRRRDSVSTRLIPQSSLDLLFVRAHIGYITGVIFQVEWIRGFRHFVQYISWKSSEFRTKDLRKRHQSVTLIQPNAETKGISCLQESSWTDSNKDTKGSDGSIARNKVHPEKKGSKHQGRVHKRVPYMK